MRERKFIKNAVRWRIFRRTVCEARVAFADVSPGDLQKVIDDAVEEVRARNQGTTSVNYNP